VVDHSVLAAEPTRQEKPADSALGPEGRIATRRHGRYLQRFVLPGALCLDPLSRLLPFQIFHTIHRAQFHRACQPFIASINLQQPPRLSPTSNFVLLVFYGFCSPKAADRNGAWDAEDRSQHRSQLDDSSSDGPKVGSLMIVILFSDRSKLKHDRPALKIV
jgi:hypothetical protein